MHATRRRPRTSGRANAGWCLALASLLLGWAAGASALGAQWPQAHSDVAADPAVRFGVLDNGMRYAILKNATPSGQVSLRLRMATGSLNESDSQQGLAHFLEHMAFRGSARVPDGEVKTSLERLGLEFGADTNAFTAPTQTVYMFNLPHNDAASLDRGLMLMREIGDDLTLDAKAFDTERGVVLSEARLNDTPSFHAFLAEQQFLFPGQLLTQRTPIGQPQIVRTAPVAQVAAYYHAYYRPERATLLVIGDVDPAAIEREIKTRFSNWHSRFPAGAEPDLGAPKPRGAEAKVFSEAGAPSTTSISWVRPFDATPDSLARERNDLIELVGLAVINRRLQDAAAAADRKFTHAAVGRQNVEHSANLTTLMVQYPQGGWRDALVAADQIRRQAVEQGVQQAEVQRELRELHTYFESTAAGAATRETPRIAGDFLEALDHNDVFTSPAQDLQLADAIAKNVDAAAVNASLKQTFAGGGPLAFVSSPEPIEGGDAAVLTALKQAEEGKLASAVVAAAAVWPYTDFGAAGKVLEQRRVEDLDLTLVRFANGVRLNIKPTQYAADQIQVRVRVGNGKLDLPRDRSTVIWAANGGAVIQGGLGKLDYPSLQQALTGKVVGTGFQLDDDALLFSGQTRPQDLNLQLQVLTAYIADPGWRPEAFAQVQSTLLPMLGQITSNPMELFQSHISGLLHGGDPRWAFPTSEAVKSGQAPELKALLAPALANGAIEVTIVGDVTVPKAIAAVAATLAALPTRSGVKIEGARGEVHFPAATPTPAVLADKGGADQGVVAMAWPTTDAFADFKADAARSLLAEIMEQRLFVVLRQRAGNSYTPQVIAQSSTTFPGFGVLLAFADTPPSKAAGFFSELGTIAADLRAKPPSEDELARARNPAVANQLQAQQSNGYWVNALGAAQSVPAFVEKARQALPDLQAVTAADVQAAARTYLTEASAWRLLVQRSEAP